jgi:hypothetical protein
MQSDILLTQDTSFEVQQHPRITDIHRLQEDIEREWVRDRLSSMQQDQEGSLSSEIRDEELEEAVDDKGLRNREFTYFSDGYEHTCLFFSLPRTDP